MMQMIPTTALVEWFQGSFPRMLMPVSKPKSEKKFKKGKRRNSKAHNKVTKCHTMLVQDSFLGSLLVLPVELWNGIAG